MQGFFELSLGIRTTMVFVIGVLLGKLVNWAIYRCAYMRWQIGPWCPPPQRLTRHWSHWLPIIGWFLMRAEGGKDDDHSRLFWFRPMVLELGLGIGLAMLYRLEVTGGLLPAEAQLLVTSLQSTLHTQFLWHAILILFLVAASFIDFDEKMIPDSITVTGTLTALVLATFFTAGRLPGVSESVLIPFQLTSPHKWDPELNGIRGLGIAVACFGAWCMAIMPMITTLRFGLWRGLLLMVASVVRPRRRTSNAQTRERPFRKEQWAVCWLIGLQWVGWLWIALVWQFGSATQWNSLVSQLLGMAFGGGMIWSVRIVGFIAMKREAMGFGDVTLMAMIGAFVGWQPCLLIFGLAPASAVIVALLQFILTRDTEIAFGPYLSLGFVICITYWDALWFRYARDFFFIGNGWFIPTTCLVLLALMCGLLWVIRLFKELVLGIDDAVPEPEA